MTTRTLLASGDPPDAAEEQFAGRVLSQQGAELVLANGFEQRWIELSSAASAADVAPGPWLVVAGQVGGSPGPMRGARIVRRHPGQLRAEGERSRFERVAPNLARVAQAKAWVRRHFDAQSFIEVSTPVRVAAPDPSVYIAPHATQDGWLITSPEFHMKRLLVGGMPCVYQFAACTRDGELGTWHEPEFTLLEWYRAFETSERVMADTETLVATLASEYGQGSALVRGERTVQIQAPFERLTVREAFQRYAGISDAADLAASSEDRYFQIFVDVVEPALASFERPVFVTEYPRSQAALAQPCEHDPSVAERFELYLAGVELCNGYGELTCAEEQLRRFEQDCLSRKQRGLPELPIDRQFIAALVEGMPPAAGNALGFERLMALVLGVALSDVVAFPALPRAT